MKKSLRRQLIDAQQAIRDQANAAHKIEQDLRIQISNLDANARAREKLLAEIEPVARECQRIGMLAETRLSDAELVGLAAVVRTEGVTSTPARQRLVAELQVRGILPLKMTSDLPVAKPAGPLSRRDIRGGEW